MLWGGESRRSPGEPAIGLTDAGEEWSRGESRRVGLSAHRRRGGWLAVASSVCAVVWLALLGGVVVLLASGVWRFFAQVPFWEFLSETRWTPLFEEKRFGVLPLLAGSLLVMTGAGLLALPVGLLAGLFWGEFAPARWAGRLRVVLLLAARIPAVAYGYFALTFLTPLLRGLFPAAGIYNAASATVALAAMIVPSVSLWCGEAFRAVPQEVRWTAVALGAPRSTLVLRVVIPAARRGVAAAFLLALGRAFGESMVVAMAAGVSPRLTLNPLEPIQTLSAYLVQVGQGGVAPGTVSYDTLAPVALLLALVGGAASFAAGRLGVGGMGGIR